MQAFSVSDSMLCFRGLCARVCMCNDDSISQHMNTLSAYRCRAGYPNDGGLLGVGQLSVNEDTLLQVQPQGDAGHEAEHNVEGKIKGIHL